MGRCQVDHAVAVVVVHREGVPVQGVHARVARAVRGLADRDIDPHEGAGAGQRIAQFGRLVGDEVARRVRHPHARAVRAALKKLVGLRHVRMRAEQDVDLAGIGNGPGVFGLLGHRVGGVLLADLGMQDDDVGSRFTGRSRLSGDPLDVIEVDRPLRVGGEAVEPVGGGQLGDPHRAPLALELVDLVGLVRLGLSAIGPAPAHAGPLERIGGADDAVHPLVPGVIGGGRAPVPARGPQGGDHARQGPERGEAGGDAVRGDGDFHAAQGQVDPAGPGLGCCGQRSDIALPALGVVHDGHVHEHVAAVSDRQMHVGRRRGGGARCGGLGVGCRRHRVGGGRRAAGERPCACARPCQRGDSERPGAPSAGGRGRRGCGAGRAAGPRGLGCGRRHAPQTRVLTARPEGP